jgi:SpoIIAA-like
MPFTITEATGPTISATISGELSIADVRQLQATAIDAIRRCGKISALFVLENFRGWNTQGDWGDVTFLSEHDKDITRIAMVGDEKWRTLIYAFLAKGFRQAVVEYFHPGDLKKAHAWLEAGSS